MKIDRNNFKNFKDIGTLVYYGPRRFYSEKSGIIEDNIYDEIKCKGYMFSVDSNSDYLDFAKYGFKFNLEKEKYWSKIKANFLDTDSKKLFEGSEHKAELIFPSLSQEEFTEKQFFGKLEDKTYLIHIPRDTWKIEIYNERITGNFSGEFYDYDILKELETPEYNPILSIYFGPLQNTKLTGVSYDEVDEYEFYASRYIGFDEDLGITEEEYKSYEELTRREYLESYNEVKSEKLFYLVLGDKVDLVSPGYLKSNVRHRNQNSFRNSDIINTEFLEKTYTFIRDKRSNTLLGTRETDCPIFENLLKNSKNVYAEKTYNEGEIVDLGDLYSCCKYEKPLKNPIISPEWTLNEELDSLFDTVFIESGEGGTTIPEGFVSVLKGSEVKVKIIPDFGYTSDKEEVIYTEPIKFKKIEYKINLGKNIQAYNESGDITLTGTIGDIIYFGIREVPGYVINGIQDKNGKYLEKEEYYRLEITEDIIDNTEVNLKVDLYNKFYVVTFNLDSEIQLSCDRKVYLGVDDTFEFEIESKYPVKYTFQREGQIVDPSEDWDITGNKYTLKTIQNNFTITIENEN